MRVTLLGTGSAGGVPLYGCDCSACQRARIDPNFIRRPCSALIEHDGTSILLDAGLVDLHERFPSGTVSAVVLTHYHPDHVQGLFHLRWGIGNQLPVFGPPDPVGCADLYKNPGILHFINVDKFEPFQIGSLELTPLPLVHSKLTYGYLIKDKNGAQVAYLTDTKGLPRETEKFLTEAHPDCVILDCCYPPMEEPPRNHNDVSLALEITNSIRAKKVILTHINHELDVWLSQNVDKLPAQVFVGSDNLVVEV